MMCVIYLLIDFTVRNLYLSLSLSLFASQILKLEDEIA